MGQARVEKISLDGQPAIRKGPLGVSERYVYRHLIRHPAYRGPAAPAVLGWQGESVLLEWIPNPSPHQIR